MCKLCLSPTTRDLLIMVAVYTIVALFLVTASGCAEQPIQPRGPMFVIKPLDTSELDRLITRNIERMRRIDNNIARLNAIDEHLDQMLLEGRHKGVQRGAR